MCQYSIMVWQKLIKFLVLSFLVTISKSSTIQPNVCNSKVCKLEAEIMKSKIDNSVSPCDNFYQFACGKFNPEISDDESETNVLTMLNDLIDEQLNRSLSEKSTEKDINPLKVVKNFYQACMDKETINKIGADRVVEKMIYLGGWPVVKSHNWDEFSWTYQKFVQTAELLGLPQNYLFKFKLIQDLQNKTRSILMIDQPDLGISKEFVVNETLVQAYHSFQVDLAVLYGADRKNAEKDMKDVLDFEIALANISKSKEERRDLSKLYNLVSVRELQIHISCLNWLDYMNALLPKDKQIVKSEIIMISSKNFFMNLQKLLTSTPQRTIANYVMWRFTLTSSPFMSDNIREKSFQYDKVSIGIKKYQPRWKKCVSLTTSFLPIASSALYDRKNFNEESKLGVMEIVNRIKEEFKTIIQTTDWMDDKTKSDSFEKLLKMKNFIGYSDELKDDKKIIEYYEDLEINKEEFFKSVLKIYRFNLKKHFSHFREPFDTTSWKSHSRIELANAFYDPNENSIIFSIAMLQGQMFSADRPKYMNYGSIGWIIGHEMTHAFEKQGTKLGEIVDRWDNDTNDVYREMAQCIVYQYGNYTELTTGLTLNGTRTQVENIADNGGLFVSYKAYNNWVKDNKEESILPGLNFSPSQLFWISAAQAWCSKAKPESVNLRITKEAHSPSMFRINGVVSNAVEFTNDFKCSESSAMNRKNKCKVW